MTDRVQAYLDGEIPRNELSEGERARLAELEAVTTGVAAALRAVRSPDLTGAVMRRLPSLTPERYEFPSAPANPFGWLGKPRSLTLTARPAFMLAAAAAIAAFALIPAEQQLTTEPIVLAAPDAPLVVQFRLEDGNAKKVELAGSFSGWQPGYELAQVGPGQWSILVPLNPGVHDYVFIVDGERRVVDPYARRAEDGNGLTISRIFLVRPKPAESRPTRLASKPNRARPTAPGAEVPGTPGFGEK